MRGSHPDSFERLFHDVGIERFLVLPKNVPELRGARRLERAIGVIYLPQSERVAHYFFSDLDRQFDAVIHFDHSRALEPLDPTGEWKHGRDQEMETYPSGI